MQGNKKVENRAKRRSYVGYLWHYYYIKNQYRLILVNLSRQKELDIDPKAN